jgi:hypothetical protein
VVVELLSEGGAVNLIGYIDITPCEGELRIAEHSSDTVILSPVFVHSMPRQTVIQATFLLTAAWLFFGLLNTAAFFVSDHKITFWAEFWNEYRTAAVYWLTWGPATMTALLLSRRFPIARSSRVFSIVRHFIASLALAELQIFFYIFGSSLVQLMFCHCRFVEVINTYNILRICLGWRLLYGHLIYWGIVGAEHAFRHYRQEQQQKTWGARMEALATSARLEALVNRLHPHFLFNSFHTIVSLIETEQYKQAREMAVGLSELLRRSLSADPPLTVNLREEFDFSSAYLNLERLRFPDRFSFAATLDPAVWEVFVPRMILQPIVENAVRYGVAATSEPSHVSLRGISSNGRLRIEVENDGPIKGASALKPCGFGMGIQLTRERLSIVYGDDYTLDFSFREQGGALVLISLPLHREIERTARGGD